MRIPQRVLDIELPPFDPLNLRAAELRAQGHEVISLGQALPYFPPPPSAVRAAQDALTSPQVHAYSTDPGRPSLRRALADRLREEINADCGPEHLVITAGANHAFATVIATLVDPGDEVVLPGPYFTNHYMQVQAAGAIAIEAPLVDQQTYDVTWDDVARAMTPRTRAVVLCNPSNPTGATITRANGERILRELAARGIWVISDETYMQFVYDAAHWSAASLSDWRRNVVVIGTFSKSFAMMGWRVGFILADRDVCEQATKIQDAMIICAPTISQLAVEAAVNEDWDYARGFHAEFKRRRQRVAERLADMRTLHWAPAGGGFFAFARVDGCADSTALATRLLEVAHVVTIPGASFGRSGEGCLRLSYGSVSDGHLAQALERLATYFAE
ncbi:MAG TPA: aminotransferase class I/II-fold pyridoxal phosphate-dependent enzyme [Vicinamibacterales bacterium]